MSELKKLIEIRRRSRSWENEARDAQGRWTDKDNQGKPMSAMGFAYAQAGLKNLIRRTKIREALRKDAEDKAKPPEEPPIVIIPPNGKEISGNPNISKYELNTIGINNLESQKAKLNKKQLQDLHFIRNGHNTLEEFLNAPPVLDENKEIGIYAGNRVKMFINYGGKVSFEVDGGYNANYIRNNNPPSKELRDMTRAWLRFTKSKAGDRIFWNNPHSEGGEKNRFDARVKMYKKYGFSDPKLDDTGYNTMVFDNRKDKTQPINRSILDRLNYWSIKKPTLTEKLGLN